MFTDKIKTILNSEISETEKGNQITKTYYSAVNELVKMSFSDKATFRSFLRGLSEPLADNIDLIMDKANCVHDDQLMQVISLISTSNVQAMLNIIISVEYMKEISKHRETITKGLQADTKDLMERFTQDVSGKLNAETTALQENLSKFNKSMSNASNDAITQFKKHFDTMRTDFNDQAILTRQTYKNSANSSIELINSRINQIDSLTKDMFDELESQKKLFEKQTFERMTEQIDSLFIQGTSKMLSSIKIWLFIATGLGSSAITATLIHFFTK